MEVIFILASVLVFLITLLLSEHPDSLILKIISWVFFLGLIAFLVIIISFIF